MALCHHYLQQTKQYKVSGIYNQAYFAKCKGCQPWKTLEALLLKVYQKQIRLDTTDTATNI